MFSGYEKYCGVDLGRYFRVNGDPFHYWFEIRKEILYLFWKTEKGQIYKQNMKGDYLRGLDASEWIWEGQVEKGLLNCEKCGSYWSRN